MKNAFNNANTHDRAICENVADTKTGTGFGIDFLRMD